MAPSGRTPYRQCGVTPKPLLVFLVANGFRNIQTIVQQLKRSYAKAHAKKSTLRDEIPFDYVEVMACPNGKHFTPESGIIETAPFPCRLLKRWGPIEGGFSRRFTVLLLPEATRLSH